jgi:hypothetical protein
VIAVINFAANAAGTAGIIDRFGTEYRFGKLQSEGFSYGCLPDEQIGMGNIAAGKGFF